MHYFDMVINNLSSNSLFVTIDDMLKNLSEQEYTQFCSKLSLDNKVKIT